MNTPFALWIVCLIFAGSGWAQTPPPAQSPQVLKLWPKAVPPDPKSFNAQAAKARAAKQDKSRIRFVDHPTLTLYPAPRDQANGAAVVVCPGGAYNVLAADHEGKQIAQWLNSLGVTAAVLHYRVPRRDRKKPHPWPLQDAQRAIRLVRHHAKPWRIDPQRIGMLGFSAGGHLTVITATHPGNLTYPKQDAADELSARPNFMIPIYAAYLGSPKSPDQLDPSITINKKTPPTFMAVTLDDKMRGVHAARMLLALHKAGVKAELHIYTQGGHGYGIRKSAHPVSTWHHRCGEWMKAMGFLKPSTSPT